MAIFCIAWIHRDIVFRILLFRCILWSHFLQCPVIFNGNPCMKQNRTYQSSASFDDNRLISY